MTTFFTVWHYLVIVICVLLFLLLSLLSFTEKRINVRITMIFTSLVVMVLVAFFMIMGVDKYTKIAEVHGLKNRRILSTEQIVFSGYVTNQGNYTIGEVTFEVKLVNRGHVSGNVKAGSFYKPSGFFDFFFGGGGDDRREHRPQQIIKTFVIARNIEAGRTETFHVTLDYPPYFEQTAFFTRVFAH